MGLGADQCAGLGGRAAADLGIWPGCGSMGNDAKEVLMARHVIDRPSVHDTGRRLQQFLKIERSQSPAPASKAAFSQPGRAGASGRVRHYTRIERQTAPS